jgi:hypothetical protein
MKKLGLLDKKFEIFDGLVQIRAELGESPTYFVVVLLVVIGPFCIERDRKYEKNIIISDENRSI